MNVLGLVMFIGIVVIKFLFPPAVFYVTFVLWIAFIAYANYSIIVKNTDITEDIKSADRKNIFKAQTHSLIKAYESVSMRKEFFETLEDDSKIKEAYNRLRRQVLSNIKSAVQYMKSYDYANCPEPTYLNRLCQENDGLMTKLSELVELLIQIESTADDADLTLVNDILESLRNVKEY